MNAPVNSPRPGKRRQPSKPPHAFRIGAGGSGRLRLSRTVAGLPTAFSRVKEAARRDMVPERVPVRFFYPDGGAVDIIIAGKRGRPGS